MITKEVLDHWGKTWLRAFMWYCGDDVCNCSQPKIIKQSPNWNMGYPWVRQDSVWEGTFRSDGEDYELLVQELKDAAARYDIPLTDDIGFSGERLYEQRHNL